MLSELVLLDKNDSVDPFPQAQVPFKTSKIMNEPKDLSIILDASEIRGNTD